MFHAISARLARLAGRIHSRLSPDADHAARYGWQVIKTGPGRYCYRDPRFDQLAARRAARAASNVRAGRS
ncbi:MAG: hypothetical protein J2P27_04265 [Actinobacteria bacterium]|nr:hypothetical protein [Actinomycetota bacterium]